MKVPVFLILGILLIFPVIAQDLERMLNAFDSPNTLNGVIIVSFDQDTTREKANDILSEYSLEIIPSIEQCFTVGTSGPGEESTTSNQCMTVDYWDESLKFAEVRVDEGKEKEIAETLIEHPNIIWIEPNYRASTLSEEPKEDQSIKEINPVKPKTNNILLYGAIILVILIITWIIFKLHKKPISNL